MTPPLLTQHPHYAALLRRWNELDDYEELTPEQLNEARAINAQLNDIECAYRQAEYDRRAGARGEAIAELTDDYEFMVGEAGNLGGCEL